MSPCRCRTARAAASLPDGTAVLLGLRPEHLGRAQGPRRSAGARAHRGDDRACSSRPARAATPPSASAATPVMAELQAHDAGRRRDDRDRHQPATAPRSSTPRPSAPCRTARGWTRSSLLRDPASGNPASMEQGRQWCDATMPTGRGRRHFSWSTCSASGSSPALDPHASRARPGPPFLPADTAQGPIPNQRAPARGGARRRRRGAPHHHPEPDRGRPRSLARPQADADPCRRRASPEGLPLAVLAPVGDEIMLPKTSSGVFNSTNVDYLLKNLGIRYLVVAGMLTDQCVDMTVRDARRSRLSRHLRVRCLRGDDAGAPRHRARGLRRLLLGRRHRHGRGAIRGPGATPHDRALPPLACRRHHRSRRHHAGPLRCRERACDKVAATGVGWVPANLCMTPFNTIAGSEPLRLDRRSALVPDWRRAIAPRGPAPRRLSTSSPAIIVDLDGAPWAACTRDYSARMRWRH